MFSTVRTVYASGRPGGGPRPGARGRRAWMRRCALAMGGVIGLALFPPGTSTA